MLDVDTNLWQTKLASMLDDRVFKKVSLHLGRSKNWLYSIVKEGSCPNAIDAVRLCRYLGTTVEAVFGEDAIVAPRGLIRKADSPDAAAKIALTEALGEVHAIRAGARRGDAKAPGKARKSG